MTPWIFVAPSSRGIGLELARRLIRTTQLPVVATARDDLDKAREKILQPRQYEFGQEKNEGRLLDEQDAARMGEEADSSKLHVLRLDVTEEDTIAQAAQKCQSLFGKPRGGSNKGDASAEAMNHLHLAMVVPGILYPEKSPAQLEEKHMLDTFRVNTIGPLLLLKHLSNFLPRKSTQLPDSHVEGYGTLPKHATWATMSARVGSIAENGLGGWYSYRASKAAVNQVTKTFDNYLKTTAGDHALAISLHPGTVRTGLSKEFWNNVQKGKLFSPEFAAKKLVDVVSSRNMSDRGKAWDWKGEEISP